MYALKGLISSLGSTNIDCRQDGAALDPSLGRSSYIFNPTIEGIEDADAILIIGSNPRREAAILNARIRKRWRMGELPIGLIGEQADLRYAHEYLGAGPETLKELVDGTNKFAAKLKRAKKPMIIIGQGALARGDGAGVLANAAKLADAVGAVKGDWNGFAVLHTAAARVGGLDLGRGALSHNLVSHNLGTDVLFLLLCDFDRQTIRITVYIGTHGDNGAHHADVILPAATYTEKSGTYVNTEGRVQMVNRAAFAPGDARDDWAVLQGAFGRSGQEAAL